MKVSKQGPWTAIEMDGRADQLTVALALTRGIFANALEHHDELRDRVVALETALVMLAPDRYDELMAEAARLDSEYYAQDRRDYYAAQWDNDPPSLAALTMPG